MQEENKSDGTDDADIEFGDIFISNLRKELQGKVSYESEGEA